MSDNYAPLAIRGWMQFRHQETGERISSPAIALFTTRPIRYGEQTRMALHLRSPITEALGTWDEVRHSFWETGNMQEAMNWTPMGFTPNDAATLEAVVSRVGQLMESKRVATGQRPPKLRATSCRFDEWFRGYSADLTWDPFRDLAPSALELARMAEHGAIPPEPNDEILSEWLSQPPSRIAARSRSSYGGPGRSDGAERPQQTDKGRAAPQPGSEARKPAHIQERGSSIQPPSKAEPIQPAQPAARAGEDSDSEPEWIANEAFVVARSVPGEPEPELDHVPEMDRAPIEEPDASLGNDSDSAPASPPSSATVAPPSSAATPAAARPPIAEPDNWEASPFDEAPAQAPIKAPPPAPTQPPTPTAPQMPSAKPEPTAPPAPTPAAAPPLAPTPPAPVQASESTASPGVVAEAASPVEALARDIFGGPELPGFSAIAQAVSQGLIRGHAAQPARDGSTEDARPANLDGPTSAQAHDGVEAPQTPQRPLAVSFARFPRHDAEGSVDWGSALFACGYMAQEAFAAARSHKRAARDGASGREESLYGLGLLGALRAAGVDFALDGVPPEARFDGAAPGSFDAENFALKALAKSSFEPASNIASLVRARFFREKLAELAKAAPREAYAPVPSEGWTQVSAGPVRPDATMAHAEQGLVGWTRPGTAERVVARLARPEDRERLAKFAGNLAQSQSACKPPHPAPHGAIPPGAAEPRAPQAWGSRPGAPR